MFPALPDPIILQYFLSPRPLPNCPNRQPILNKSSPPPGGTRQPHICYVKKIINNSGGGAFEDKDGPASLRVFVSHALSPPHSNRTFVRSVAPGASLLCTPRSPLPSYLLSAHRRLFETIKNSGRKQCGDERVAGANAHFAYITVENGGDGRRATRVIMLQSGFRGEED